MYEKFGMKYESEPLDLPDVRDSWKNVINELKKLIIKKIKKLKIEDLIDKKHKIYKNELINSSPLVYFFVLWHDL